jgi:predicted permease
MLKKVGLMPEDFSKRANKLVFRALLPPMLFLNVYKIKSIGDVELGFVFYALAAIVVIYAIAVPTVMLFVKDGAKRGTLIQSVFRSNYAIIGIPLAESLFGAEGAAIASVLSAILIPVFNILAVITLSIFCKSEKKVTLRSILLGILKNPLIDGVLLGLAALGIRAIFVRYSISFRLSDVTPLYSALSSVGSLATPLALLVLGAQFEFSALKGAVRELVFGTIARCVCVPLATLSAAYFVFANSFGGAQFAALVAAFGTPVAVSTVPMAQEMGADHELAGQLVIATTLGSCITVFIASAIFKSVGIF